MRSRRWSDSGAAGAAGWRSLRVDGTSEASFTQSVTALQDKLSPARLYVFTLALQDLWVQGTKSAEGQQREYTASEYLQRLNGLGYDEIVTLADPTGDTAQARYATPVHQTRLAAMPSGGSSSPRSGQIGPTGERVRGTIDSGPAYQHSLRTMRQ